MKKNTLIRFYNLPGNFKPILTKAVKKTLKLKRNIRRSEINIILISDKAIKKLNNKFRKVNRITDVISFCYSSKPLVGEIYIAKERSKLQAKEQKHTWKKELIYLVIHGILHLLGFTDYTKNNSKKMFSKQNFVFKNL
ncbi:MAG: rRNA maturation RNase YbeY [Endomicrobiales bacterium]|nr:rRNA maturation RNase YbeY [Endomicrobiales bacterium]